ncbi:MAG: alpha/beta hydrolase [Leptolyngbyaceae cyanobacterium SM2_3_12]|nr:alpha/beta hydrolase [Leptolyngbyaceae cyanobacterium SM2_3_12]
MVEQTSLKASFPWPGGSLNCCLKGLCSLGIILAPYAGLAWAAPPSQALDNIQLTYGVLQSTPIALADLKAFGQGGLPSRDIQLLLNILKIDPAWAQEVLTREIPVDAQGLRDVSNTFIGEAFWRLVGTTVTFSELTEPGWEQLQNALIAAAADDRVTVLEVLENIEASLVIIDTQRVATISSQVREDIDDVQSFFSNLQEAEER